MMASLRELCWAAHGQGKENHLVVGKPHQEELEALLRYPEGLAELWEGMAFWDWGTLEGTRVYTLCDPGDDLGED